MPIQKIGGWRVMFKTGDRQRIGTHLTTCDQHPGTARATDWRIRGIQIVLDAGHKADCADGRVAEIG